MMYAIADIQTGDIKHCSQYLHMAAVAYVPGTAHGKGRTQFEAISAAKGNAYLLKKNLAKYRPIIVRAEERLFGKEDGPEPETSKA